MEHRFRHTVLGTVVTHSDPTWADRHPQYEPTVKTDPVKDTLNELTKAELVAEARRRGLPVSGTKSELVERLR